METLGLALACLIVLACAETSFGPRKSQPDQQSQQPPVLAVTFQPNQLNFIPEPGSLVELQGHATIGTWTSRTTDIHSEITLDTDATAAQRPIRSDPMRGPLASESPSTRSLNAACPQSADRKHFSAHNVITRRQRRNGPRHAKCIKRHATSLDRIRVSATSTEHVAMGFRNYSAGFEITHSRQT